MANEIESKLEGTQYNSLSEHVHLYKETSIVDKYAPIKIQCKTYNQINPGSTKT